jgi:hypothetical protein
VKQFSRLGVAAELLHLPDKPAGVEVVERTCFLALELLHLPGKPEGVEQYFP